jgi:hypothetical protein
MVDAESSKILIKNAGSSPEFFAPSTHPPRRQAGFRQNGNRFSEVNICINCRANLDDDYSRRSFNVKRLVTVRCPPAALGPRVHRSKKWVCPFVNPFPSFNLVDLILSFDITSCDFKT